MPEKSFDMMAVRHVEMAISRLDSLLTLPCTAAAYLPKLMQSRFRPADVAEIVESDPALAIKIFIVAEEYGVNVPNERFSLRQILDRLPAHIVRDALLSIKGYPAADDNTEGSEIWVREGLTTHTLGVACCAREIAGIITPPKADFEYRHSAFQAEPFAAYSAGLLHDIGKFALQEIMPKSFSQMFEEAQSTNVSFCTVEKEHLGTDHTLLGKKLAARWHLPQVFSLAIWLHHNDTATISQNVAQAQIAQIIQSADSIVRYSGIGQSGSFDLAGMD